jgi:hypothetical protein
MGIAFGTAWLALVGPGVALAATPMDAPELLAQLAPQPQQLTLAEGRLPLRGARLSISMPCGPEDAACREVLETTLRGVGARATIVARAGGGCVFRIGDAPEAPPLPTSGPAPEQGYSLAIGPRGIVARAGSPEGLLNAAQCLRQIVRLGAESGALPCLTIVDWPEFRWRGVYIEGGQERFGRIVEADYLCEQIRRLSEFRMNALVVECYNLFPYPSFPECADEGTLTVDECRRVVAESKRWHVTLIPSLQTLAQAYELVWLSEAGAPYRESTAPGMMCPSTPEVYPFIKGLYRDLLTLFDETPVIGVGCSEIDMQWQSRYCPKCAARVAAGETVRDLLLGHADKCIDAVHNLAREMGRDVRPLMWADEFTMYGPGRDWVGIERIPRDTVMGYWKYWPDYAGIEGLLARGYDVFGISAIYNHCFYLADISPEDPPKSWPSMEQTGVANITGMMETADAARRANAGASFLGTATASFSKHRLRAFDSLWYGFALNGQCTWSNPGRPLDEYQRDFTRAFVRHYYDARTEESARALATAWERLDHCKSLLELANQTLHDVVGVIDTQEAGYVGNTFPDAFRRVGELTRPDGTRDPALASLLGNAARVEADARGLRDLLEAQRPAVGAARELADLWLAAEQIEAHAERQLLMAETQTALTRQASAAERVALAARWSAHAARMEEVLDRLSRLYSRGDPCGLQGLLHDMRTLRDWLVEPPLEEQPGEVLLDEPFQALDRDRWVVRGEPAVADGHLETSAPGGWENYSGVTTREALALEEDRPLIVEFALTPLTTGVDSQLFGAGTPTGDVAYRFCLYGTGSRFAVHAQLSASAEGQEAGWKQRGLGPPMVPGTTYRVRAAITRRSFRVIVRDASVAAGGYPVWDTGLVPMDELADVHLLLCDVEPPGATAATRWGAIRAWRPRR